MSQLKKNTQLILSTAILTLTWSITPTFATLQHNHSTEPAEHTAPTQPADHSETETTHDQTGSHNAEAETVHNLAVQKLPTWYPYFIGGAALLFLAAISVGSAAVIMQGPQPSNEPRP